MWCKHACYKTVCRSAQVTQLKHFYSASVHTATALLFFLLGDWCLLLLVKLLALSGAVWNWCYICRWLFFHVFSYLLLSPFVVTISFLFLVVVVCQSRTASSLDRCPASASTFFLRAPLMFFFLFFSFGPDRNKKTDVREIIYQKCPRQLEQTHVMLLPVSSVSVSGSFLFLRRPLSRSWRSPSPLSSWTNGTFPKTHLLTPSKI